MSYRSLVDSKTMQIPTRKLVNRCKVSKVIMGIKYSVLDIFIMKRFLVHIYQAKVYIPVVVKGWEPTIFIALYASIISFIGVEDF